MERVLEAPRLERRLVAILAADIVGYSRHMERDETAALATLSRLRVVADELIASHKGRITGTAGDSILAEFSSVVDALDCAVKIQAGVATTGEDQVPEQRMQFRIGVNVGDVMVKDGDIFGDGVNIAARLETLAQPGGICVSRGVRDHVRKMGRYAFEDLGEQSVKNIAQPIRAFRLHGLEEGPPDPAVADPPLGLAPTAVAAPAPAVSTPAPFELPFWDTIKESKDPAEFSAYLEQYPNGVFASLAEARRDALLAEQAEPAAAPAAEPDLVTVELAFWESIKESTDPAEFAAYLERGIVRRPRRGAPPVADRGTGGAGPGEDRGRHDRAHLLGFGEGQRQSRDVFGLSREISPRLLRHPGQSADRRAWRCCGGLILVAKLRDRAGR
jgi:adenylate cyclase